MHVVDTERLRLRWLEPDDAGFILELTNDPAWLLHIGDRGIRSEDDALRYIADGPRAMCERLGFGLYAVERLGGGRPIGLCGLIRRDWLDDVDIGFAFLPAYRRRGYALEAARATLEHARTGLGLQRIAAIVSPGNADSIRLLGKLGLTFAGWKTPPNGAEPVCVFVTAADRGDGGRGPDERARSRGPFV